MRNKIGNAAIKLGLGLFTLAQLTEATEIPQLDNSTTSFLNASLELVNQNQTGYNSTDSGDGLSSGNGLSSGGIAGVTVGVIAFCCICIGCCLVCDNDGDCCTTATGCAMIGAGTRLLP